MNLNLLGCIGITIAVMGVLALLFFVAGGRIDIDMEVRPSPKIQRPKEESADGRD